MISKAKKEDGAEHLKARDFANCVMTMLKSPGDISYSNVNTFNTLGVHIQTIQITNRYLPFLIGNKAILSSKSFTRKEFKRTLISMDKRKQNVHTYIIDVILLL